MKKDIQDNRVVLTAENSDDAFLLFTTPYTLLREKEAIPTEKALTLDFDGWGNLKKSTQIIFPKGGYTVIDG